MIVVQCKTLYDCFEKALYLDLSLVCVCVRVCVYKIQIMKPTVGHMILIPTSPSQSFNQ